MGFNLLLINKEDNTEVLHLSPKFYYYLDNEDYKKLLSISYLIDKNIDIYDYENDLFVFEYTSYYKINELTNEEIKEFIQLYYIDMMDYKEELIDYYIDDYVKIRDIIDKCIINNIKLEIEWI